MNFKNRIILAGLALVLSLQACRPFENSLELDIPPFTPELFVECYLVPGKPYRLTLSQTQDYLAEFNNSPFYNNAIVEIELQGVRHRLTSSPSTLNFAEPFFDGAKTYNFASASTDLVPKGNNLNFKLYVNDTLKNRKLEAETGSRLAISFDSVRARINLKPEVSGFAYFKDPAGVNNYYRYTLHQNTITSETKQDIAASDALFDGTQIPFGSRYDMEKGDTLIFTLCHIDSFYYKFLRNVGGSVRSAGSPFAQPNRMISNINGGKGIFTYLPFVRDSIIVPK
jgi:hypothetical protein